MQRKYADPPFYPEALYNSLGEAYLDAKSPLLAAKAFEKALTLTHNDLFALSGLVRAYAAAGEKTKAQDAMARLLFVTSDADKGLPILHAGQGHRHHRGAARFFARAAAQLPARRRSSSSARTDGSPTMRRKLDVRDAAGKRVDPRGVHAART